MDPVSLFALGKTLLQSGPALVRGIGALLGGRAAEVTGKVADLVDQVKGLPEEQANARLERMLKTLPPEDLVALKSVESRLEVELARIEAAREAERLRAETERQAQDQETRRAEAASADAYVRRTRPRLARLSQYAAMAYILVTGMVFPVFEAALPDVSGLPGIDWTVLMAIYAPALEYNGVRTIDKWRAFMAGKAI